MSEKNPKDVEKKATEVEQEAADVSDPVNPFVPQPPKSTEAGRTMSTQKMGNVRALADENPNATVLEHDGPTPELVEVRRGQFGTADNDTSGFGGLRRPITRPAGSVPPYGEWYDEAVEIINETVPGAIERVVVDHGGLTLLVHAEKMLELAWVLRDDARLRFEVLPSVSGVHFPADVDHELVVVYHFLSMTHRRRVRVQTAVPETNPHVPSIVRVYPAADWHERETWDMFGVIFDGHPALTRILMPDDWPGHPQRKDYPLGGVPVEYKGATIAPPDERRSYSK